VTVEAPGRDVVAIQMLRGIAATMVVFVHIDNQLRRLNYGTFGWDWLVAGVDIFFVISGFIMWTSVARRDRMTASEFLRHRLIRIVPLYWFVSTVVVAVAVVEPHVLKTTVLRPWHAVASFLFLPARHPVTGHFWPLVIPGWSLNYEMLFYVVFAISIGIGGQSRFRRLALIAGMLGAILIIASLTKSRFDVMNFYADPILLEFLAGVLLGIVWRTGWVLRSYYWAFAVGAGFALLWLGHLLNGGFPIVALSATMIVAGAVFMPPLDHNPLSSLGDASYSLYLTHTATLAALGFVWQSLFWYLDWRLFVVTGVASAILLSFVTYAWFEAPVTAALKRATKRSPVEVSSASTLTGPRHDLDPTIIT
jgi:exopolysaccharide production protein ExoZ